MAASAWVIIQGENVKVSKVIPATYEKMFNTILEEIDKETNLKENGTPRVFVKAEGKWYFLLAEAQKKQKMFSHTPLGPVY